MSIVFLKNDIKNNRENKKHNYKNIFISFYYN